MKYVLTPTDDDILHYKKGSESKSHKYISRVLNKGKWVYIYAKNRARGNKVTNQTKGTTPYSPGIKTKLTTVPGIGSKSGPHTKQVLGEPRSYLGPNTHATMNNGQKETVTNNTRGTTPYNPNVKTVENEVTKWTVPKGNTVASIANTHTFKVMTQVMDPTTKQSGLEAFNNIIQSQQKESVTNRSYSSSPERPIDYQYTPSYKTSPKPYNPTYTSKNVANRYSPTISTLNDGSTMSYQMHGTENEGNGLTRVYNRYLPMNARAESKDKRSPEEKEAIRKARKRNK